MTDPNQPLSFQALFDGVAPLYEARIIKAFAPLAANLVDWIDPAPAAVALDVGTGTGIAARLAAAQARQVVGLDFSLPMLAEARQAAGDDYPNLAFIQADAHQLPFGRETFDLVLASFGFNATDPRRSLPEAYRVLKPGGQLCFQEWGGLHRYDDILIDTIADFAVDQAQAPDDVRQLRAFVQVERPWYRDLQLEDDYRMDLAEYGFRDVWVKEHQPVAVRLPVDDFVRYKTAWTPPRLELAAMDASARGDCLDTLRRRFYEQADPHGILTYDPLLFRVRAVK